MSENGTASRQEADHVLTVNYASPLLPEEFHVKNGETISFKMGPIPNSNQYSELPRIEVTFDVPALFSNVAIFMEGKTAPVKVTATLAPAQAGVTEPNYVKTSFNCRAIPKIDGLQGGTIIVDL